MLEFYSSIILADNYILTDVIEQEKRKTKNNSIKKPSKFDLNFEGFSFYKMYFS